MVRFAVVLLSLLVWFCNNGLFGSNGLKCRSLMDRKYSTGSRQAEALCGRLPELGTVIASPLDARQDTLRVKREPGAAKNRIHHSEE